MANPDCCPHCGGKWGLITKETVKFTRNYDWDGTYDSGDVGDKVSGGKNVYCAECMKDVTALVTIERPA